MKTGMYRRPLFASIAIALLSMIGVSGVPKATLASRASLTGGYRPHVIPRGGSKKPQKRKGKTCHHGKTARQRRHRASLRRA